MGKRVLLIEDEPNIIEAITFLLKHDGWSVSSHSDGANAIEVVQRTQPDLLILDVMLPNRSGFDILQELRANDQTPRLPILMLTAKGQAKDREIAERFGADVYMTKPFSNQEMRDAVRRLATP
ncbi:MAG: DNA-binding response OmpR family regulator [Paracoccaceae bacterium]